jgi:hypothetical protein
LRTGIAAGENQARRLLNDIASFRAYLEQKQGRPVTEIYAANRWLEEVFDPVIAMIPEALRGRLAPAEIFHEVLEHRWYMSEAAGRDVGTTAAAKDYVEHVLPKAPEPLNPLRPALGLLGGGLHGQQLGRSHQLEDPGHGPLRADQHQRTAPFPQRLGRQHQGPYRRRVRETQLGHVDQQVLRTRRQLRGQQVAELTGGHQVGLAGEHQDRARLPGRHR